ncbi:MAG: MFS transporter [Actinophytocola sp.]|uniref:MFS transporter n=1 Tax=Actinophytocola sp. TaxID=1872138 RepID=UPI00132A3E93|nr:MFS transporter [Actinophytocola sp.]MPZ83753.1 MFS transporter [Actinophytocola sp.]
MSLRWPAAWLVATFASNALVQVAVTLARPVSTYRLLALHADATAVGAIAVAFALPPMLLAIFLGRWSDRSHPGLMMTVASCLAGGSTLLMARSTSVVEIGFCTALLGIGHLGAVVASQSIVAQGSTVDEGINRFGMLTLSAAVGQMTGPLLGGLLAQADGQHADLASTSLSLTVGGLVGLVAVPAAAITLRARSPVARGERVEPVPARRMVRIRGMPAALLASFAAKGSADLLLAYLPLLGAAVGIGATGVGLLLSLNAAGSFLSRAAMPWLVRRVRPLRLVVVSTAASAVFVALLPLGRDLAVLAGPMALLGFLLALTQTITMVRVVALVPEHSRGSALGLRLAGNRVGQVTVPGLAGLLAGATGIASVFYLLGVVLAGITLAVLRFGRSGQDST